MKRKRLPKAGVIGRRAVVLIAAAAVSIGAAPPVAFYDLATAFERIADATTRQSMEQRIEAVRDKLNLLLPGVYPPGIRTDRRIAKALADFPAQRSVYDRVVRDFPETLNSAVTRFRKVFPTFVSPLPIYLYHSLGVRDGGSDYLEPGHRHVMFFGADMIAKLHPGASLQPFLDHELFHLEHAHAFPDCDQFWCVLWQEGLAVDAAATMTPSATDNQLLLDTPAPIRTATDRHWIEALCFVATHFDNTNNAVIGQALMVNGKPPTGLPDRFGYYVGYRLSKATGRDVSELAQLNHEAARPLLRSTLMRLMVKAESKCAPPTANATITETALHPR